MHDLNDNKPRARFQFSLGTLVSIALIAAVLMMYLFTHAEMRQIKAENHRLKVLVGEKLEIASDSMVYTRVRGPFRSDRPMQWRIYLPERSKYRLCFSKPGAMLTEFESRGKEFHSCDVPSGEFDLLIRTLKTSDGVGHVIIETTNDKGETSESQASGYDLSFLSTPSYGYFGSDTDINQHQPGTSLPLFSIRKVTNPGPPDGTPSLGIMFWLEPK